MALTPIMCVTCDLRKNLAAIRPVFHPVGKWKLEKMQKRMHMLWVSIVDVHHAVV